MPSDVIISIRPKFAEAILSGNKSVELRRRIQSLPLGTRMWIYATKPTGAVIGSAILCEVLQGSPLEIWGCVQSRAGVSEEEFAAYFDGTDSATGLVLKNVRRVKAIGMDALRQIRPGFHPPQVITKLIDEEANALEILATKC